MDQTFRIWLNGRKSTKQNMKTYLRQISVEWWNHEFKAAGGRETPGIRKAVCAMANGRGGEVFAGVANDRSLEGCEFNEQTLRQILSQPGARPGDWYQVNLCQVVRAITSVPLGSADRTVFVLEVVPPGITTFFLEEDGELSLYVREGESSLRAGGFRALEWSRRLVREEILRTCYLELRSLARVIGGGMNLGIATDLGLTLPYLTKRLEDGTFYRYLTPEDLLQTLGESHGLSGYTGGTVQDIFQARYEIRRMQERHQTDAEIRRVLDRAREHAESRIQTFGNYLQRSGIAIG